MKTRLRTIGAPRPGHGRPLADERGFLLVMVMVVMLVLSTMVASTLVNSFLERSLAKNQNYASVALQAAEGGLAAGMTWVRENQASLPNPYTANPNWTQTLTRSLSSGGTYNATLRFKREWRDVNGDGDCTDPGESSAYTDTDPGPPEQSPANACPGDIVLYNGCSGADNCFNFPDSLYLSAGEGYPVIEIDSIGYFGSDSASASSFREIALDIARNKIDIQVEGAVTARGPITVAGSGYTDGHNFNEAGTAVSGTCGSKPGVTVDTGVAPPACDAGNDPLNPPGASNPKGLYGGTPCTAVYDPTAPGNSALGTNPWDVMQIPQADFLGMFPPITNLTNLTGTAANPTYIYQTTDASLSGNQTGFGILVVHNPNFDPVQWAAQCAGGVTGVGYCVNANKPAQLTLQGNITYTGVIIADQVVRGSGSAYIVGGLISMGGVNVNGDITGNFAIKYSCDAIEKALGGFGYGTKIAWHRLR